MRVNVTDLHRRGDPHGFETDAPGIPWGTVLYVPVPRWTQLEAIEPLLDAQRAQWRRSAQAAVLRLHRPEADRLRQDRRLIEDLRRRFDGRPLLLCTLGDGGAPVTESLIDAVSFDADALHRALRAAELDALLTLPGVLLPANDDFHYQGPNGKLYKSFIRVGTAVQGPDVLECLAFWIVEHLVGGPVVVLDTWTIISIGLALSRYVGDCGLSHLAPRAIETPRSYDEDRALLMARLRAIRGGDDSLPVLVLSSVSSTGQQAEELADGCRSAGFTDVRNVALYGPTGAPDTMCPQDAVGRYWSPTDDDFQLTTPAVPIDKTTYLLDVSVLATRTRINRPNAQQAWEFFDRYRGADCISVHRDQHDSERHHAIYVDVTRLAETPAFQHRLEQLLVRLDRADVVLCPDHRAAADLAGMVARRLSCPRIICDEDQLTRLGDADRELLRSARRILIVDDCVITGSRLRGYRQHLLDAGFVTEGDPPEIHLLVGVARTDDNTSLRWIADMVDDPSRFHPVETLLLPHWDEIDCPWCWELSQLRAARGPNLPHSEALADRYYALQDVKHGLSNRLFLFWGPEHSPAEVPRWTLGPGSIFHATTQAELFAAVASAVQSLRAAGDLSERFAPPLSKVLDPKFWLRGRYYDAVLTACILRATRRHDVRTTTIEAEVSRDVDSRLGEQAYRPLRAELLLACARGHLPMPTTPGLFGRVLEDPQADVAVAVLLGQLLGDQSPS